MAGVVGWEGGREEGRGMGWQTTWVASGVSRTALAGSESTPTHSVVVLLDLGELGARRVCAPPQGRTESHPSAGLPREGLSTMSGFTCHGEM